jgi:DNA-binding beta-propeller fold protein YncE
MDDTLLADGIEDAFIGFFQRVGKPRGIAYDYETQRLYYSDSSCCKL